MRKSLISNAAKTEEKFQLPNHFFKEMFEHFGGIVGQPGMNGRGLDNRAALRGQPVEPLTLRKLSDNSCFRRARADFRDDVEILADGCGFPFGREAF